MKLKSKSLLISGALGLMVACSNFAVNAATRVSVTQFVDKANNSSCRWQYDRHWWHDIGQAFREMLISELIKNSKVEIYERETIRQINNDEHELVNADESDSANPQKKKFKKAQITLVGAVSEFEFCSGGAGFGVDVGSLIGATSVPVKFDMAQAKVVVDLRVIDVETGRVLGSVRGAGHATSTDVDVGNFFNPGAPFNVNAFSNSPLGDAAREAIAEAAEKTLKIIPERS